MLYRKLDVHNRQELIDLGASLERMDQLALNYPSSTRS